MATNKVNLTKINRVCNMESVLPTKPMSELTLKKKYMVFRLRQVVTKYGTTVVAELHNQFQVSLPGRIAKAFEEDLDNAFEDLIESAESNNLYMYYFGGPYNVFKIKIQ